MFIIFVNMRDVRKLTFGQCAGYSVASALLLYQTIIMSEIIEVIRRGDCFKLLAACFYEPDRSLLLEEKIGENLEYLLEEIHADGGGFARAMQISLTGIEQEQLAVEHAALFVGPFELIAAPYGSVYTEKSRRVMGQSTIETARYYQDVGLSVDVKEPPDHIVVELEFMYFLCSKEAATAQNRLYDEAQRFRDLQIGFYHHAMKPWIGQFCDAIRKGTDNEFYVNLAECLDCFLLSCEITYSGD